MKSLWIALKICHPPNLRFDVVIVRCRSPHAVQLQLSTFTNDCMPRTKFSILIAFHISVENDQDNCVCSLTCVSINVFVFGKLEKKTFVHFIFPDTSARELIVLMHLQIPVTLWTDKERERWHREWERKSHLKNVLLLESRESIRFARWMPLSNLFLAYEMCVFFFSLALSFSDFHIFSISTSLEACYAAHIQTTR